MDMIQNPVYIYPQAARKKLKLAQNEGRNVYIYAMVGYGKSALVEHFLEKRKYIRLDVENSLIDDFEIPERKTEKRRVVVVENLQFVENAEIKEKIHQLVMRKDLWVILVSRAECPPWLMDLNYGQDAFMLIDEKDLTLSKKEMRWSSIFVTFTLKKIIDWNISFQTVSCIHLMNVDVYDCNSHIHNPTCFHLTHDLFQNDSVV